MGSGNRSDRREYLSSTLGGILKARREARGLSLTQLAAEAGISRPYLSRLERGEYIHPSVKVLIMLAECLGIASEDLYALTGYLRPTELPSFGPYLRAKHPDWPESVRAELTEFYDFLSQKYSLN